MKKLLITCLIGTTALLFSCKKQTIEPSTNSPQTSGVSNVSQTSIPKIEIVDGMFSFENQEDLYQAHNVLCNMFRDDRIKWYSSYGIYTQQYRNDLAISAQIKFEQDNYSDVEPGLSREELSAMGLEPQFCHEIQTGIEEGIFTLSEGKYGFYSLNNTFNHPIAKFIANNEGFYIVNDTLVYTSNDYIAIKPYSGIQDKDILKRKIVSEENGVIIFERGDDRTTYAFYMDDIFGNHLTINDPRRYYDSSTERFYHYVDFESSIGSNIYSMSSHFYTETKAEKRVFWVWATRSSYLPIDYIDGSYSYFWVRLNWNTSQSQYFYNNLSGGTNYSPFTVNPPNMTNLIGASLNPSGNYFLSSPYSFDVPVFIQTNTMHIHGYYIGSTGNYNTNYYK